MYHQVNKSSFFNLNCCKNKQTVIFCKKTVDEQKEKQSNSAPLSEVVILLCKEAPIAQLVEQRIENPRVPGSIPGRGTI